MTIALTIGGSDPSGGAGIQADLKTFSALKVYGMSVITALTAQSTQGVDGVFAVPPEFVEQQISSIMNDSTISCVKMGMLMNKEIVYAVSKLLKQYKVPFIVLDTVMIAKGGQALLRHDAIDAIRQYLIPLSTIITPNLPEAASLLNCEVATNEKQMLEQGKALLQFGCQAVLIKGGHLSSDESPDYFVTEHSVNRLSVPRVNTKNTHGTGCTLSAAITALLPKMQLLDAVQQAKIYINNALKHADNLNIGKGIGPTHHFHHWW